MQEKFDYSDRFCDDTHEYRMVTVPRALLPDIRSKLNKEGVIDEEDWRSMGIKQSRGWTHYGNHSAEPHILLFKRLRCTDPKTGLPDSRIQKQQEIESEETWQAMLKEYRESNEHQVFA